MKDLRCIKLLIKITFDDTNLLNRLSYRHKILITVSPGLVLWFNFAKKTFFFVITFQSEFDTV